MLRLYLRLVGVQLRSKAHYRVSFVFEVLSTAMIVLFEFGSLGLAFERFETLKGWNLAEVAFLYGSVELAFGVMDLLFSGFDPPYFSNLVRKGTFDQLLLRPVNITIQVLGADFAVRRMGKIALGAVIFGTALALNPIQWTVWKVLYLPVVLASMVCFFGGLFIAGAALTFWTVESFETINIFTYGGSLVIAHPMHIYQNWLRGFFTYVLPAIFLNFYPALYILGKPDPLGFPAFAPFLSPFVGLGVLAAALAFWRFGIRHYKSTGS